MSGSEFPRLSWWVRANLVRKDNVVIASSQIIKSIISWFAMNGVRCGDLRADRSAVGRKDGDTNSVNARFTDILQTIVIAIEPDKVAEGSTLFYEPDIDAPIDFAGSE